MLLQIYIIASHIIMHSFSRFYWTMSMLIYYNCTEQTIMVPAVITGILIIFFQKPWLPWSILWGCH